MTWLLIDSGNTPSASRWVTQQLGPWTSSIGKHSGSSTSLCSPLIKPFDLYIYICICIYVYMYMYTYIIKIWSRLETQIRNLKSSRKQTKISPITPRNVPGRRGPSAGKAGLGKALKPVGFRVWGLGLFITYDPSNGKQKNVPRSYQVTEKR